MAVRGQTSVRAVLATETWLEEEFHTVSKREAVECEARSGVDGWTV